MFVLLAMFGAPIVEEIAFRGLLFGALAKGK
jgi:membrane protease YdiL (CAAX protease family)